MPKNDVDNDVDNNDVDNNDDDNVYNSDTYSDQELLEFLNVSPSVTDRELEAKIVQMINQYTELPQVYAFFKDVYRRFFQVDDPDQEGFDNMMIPEVEVLQDKKVVDVSVAAKIKKEAEALVQTAADEMFGKVDPRTTQSVVLTKGLDYVADPKGLNPTLNNTIQRVIIIDSRCRDRTIYPSSTDFTLNLSENLKHVLALNFYYVNVPYTWYTISKAYGANLIFLNGTAPGIVSLEYALKLSIEPGNYTTPQALVDAVQKGIQALAAVRTDISFGTSNIRLTSTTAGSGRATFTWDIHNRFGDSNYSLTFPYWTSAADSTPTTLNNGPTLAQISIPGFLGFLKNNTYALSSLVSDFDYAYVAGVIDLDDSTFVLDSSNNVFTIYNHSSTSDVAVDPADASTYYDKITVTVATGPGTRADIMRKVNLAMQANPALDPTRSVLSFENSTFTNTNNNTNSNALDYVQRFRLNLQLNRFQTKNYTGQCQTILFPLETTTTTTRPPVWTGRDSAFYFSDKTTALRVNATLAEVGSANGTVAEDTGLTSAATYIYTTMTESPSLRFTCTRYPTPINNANNSFEVTVPNKDNYTLATLLTAINDRLRATIPTIPDFHRLFYYDYDGANSYNSNSNSNFESAVYAEIGFQQNYDYSHYTVDASNSILCTDFGLPATMDFSNNTNVYESTFPLSPNGYIVNNQNRIAIIRTKTPNQEPPLTVYFPYASPKPNAPNDGTWYKYRDLTSLEHAINTGQYGFSQYQNQNIIYQNAPNGNVHGSTTELQEPLYGRKLCQSQIKFTLQPDGQTAKCTLTWNITNTVTEQDFQLDLSGVDTWTNILGFSTTSSYNLSDEIWSPVGSTAATIYAERDVETSTINIVDSSFPGLRVQNNQLLVTPNANAPSLSSTADSITLSIQPHLYNRFALTRALNAAFSENPVTRGTKFVWGGDDAETVRIDWNINKIYTAQDYSLTFFDVYEFGHCEPHTTGNSSLTSIRWDQTLGWLLGYRSIVAYDMSPTVATSSNTDISYYRRNVYTYNENTNVVSIEGDTPVNINIYNQLHIVLDDFAGNHMNDGIITVAPPGSQETYVGRSSQTRCDVQSVAAGTGGQSVPGFISLDRTADQGRAAQVLSAPLVYANAVRLESQRNLQNTVAKTYSPSPNVKDLFALVPLKLTGLNVGQTYTEFGGTLQQNNRKYFGPVSIRRMGIKLISDRGDVVDLNNNDWSVGIICDISVQRR